MAFKNCKRSFRTEPVWRIFTSFDSNILFEDQRVKDGVESQRQHEVDLEPVFNDTVDAVEPRVEEHRLKFQADQKKHPALNESGKIERKIVSQNLSLYQILKEIDVYFLIVKNAYGTKCTLPTTISPQAPASPTKLNKKSAFTILFALSIAFQNDMTWLGSAKNHGVDRFKVKGLDAGQGLPCRDWAGVLPTQKFIKSNPLKFHSILSIHSKVIHDFLLHRQTDRQMDRQIPYKTNHPTTLYGCVWKNVYPIFYTSRSLTPFCSNKLMEPI